MRRTRLWRLLGLIGLFAALLLPGGCKKGASENNPGVDGGANVPSGPPPVIACDQPEYNYGSVGVGQEVTHTFIIKNKGEGALKIQRAQGG
jgi:hypothetical protein